MTLGFFSYKPDTYELMFHASSLKRSCFQLLHLLLLMVSLVLFITKILNVLQLKLAMHLQQHYLITLTILEKDLAFFFMALINMIFFKRVDFSDNFYLFAINENLECNSEGHHQEIDGHIASTSTLSNLARFLYTMLPVAYIPEKASIYRVAIYIMSFTTFPIITTVIKRHQTRFNNYYP